ncbi:MFS transporter [Microbacterium sp. NPDC078428]|uniref:MFS transporter n=1 Tax=Microbacterium sp. NPDC078428 TaxID=3364190 RepID=UPI0037C7A573
MSRQASRGASVHLPERTRTPGGSALVALDSAGAGMYLPVAALFLIQVRGFSVADAGLALGIGAGVGLLFPVLAATLVDRVGPRRVIGTGQLLRAIAMLVYLLVPGWPRGDCRERDLRRRDAAALRIAIRLPDSIASQRRLSRCAVRSR